MANPTFNAFPSLQLQCLYSLVSRLNEYSTQTLSLLPVTLRKQLLRNLPVVDICRLEEDNSTFVNGFDSDDIWKELYEERISTICRTVDGGSLASQTWLVRLDGREHYTHQQKMHI